MNRRHALFAILASLVATPALAADAARRQRPAPGSGGTSSSSKPGVAERSNNRVRRTTQTRTADKVKARTNKADDAMNRLVGNKKRASR